MSSWTVEMRERMVLVAVVLAMVGCGSITPLAPGGGQDPSPPDAAAAPASGPPAAGPESGAGKGKGDDGDRNGDDDGNGRAPARGERI